MGQDLSLDQDVLTNTQGAAKLLGIPAATLVKWRSTGHNNIPYVKIGHHVKYRTADLRAYIEAHTRT
jgi:excisionase family DNA binding protein